MNLVPSVSRSSGLQDDGDTLKDPRFQEEYMLFIEDKLRTYWQQYPIKSHLASHPDDKQKHAQSNILILFRKLREGIIASRRLDEFTLQVYQTSLNLSVIFRMPIQTTAIVTQLIPHRYNETGLYESVSRSIAPSPSTLTEDFMTLTLQNTPKPSQKNRKTKTAYPTSQNRRVKYDAEPEPQRNKPPAKRQVMSLPSQIELAILISLLNTLVYEYPRQDSFHSLFRWFYCLDKGNFWKKDSPSFRYTRELMEALIYNNLSRFEELSKESSIKELFDRIMSFEASAKVTEENLAQVALMACMNDIRLKVQNTAWEVLRAAYREADSVVSEGWLVKVLVLPVPLADDTSSVAKSNYLHTWLLNRPRTQITPKEELKGRWILHR